MTVEKLQAGNSIHNDITYFKDQLEDFVSLRDGIKKGDCDNWRLKLSGFGRGEVFNPKEYVSNETVVSMLDEAIQNIETMLLNAEKAFNNL